MDSAILPEIVTLRDPLTESNCYILANQGRAILIDPNQGDKIQSTLEDRGWHLDFILLTHEHCDHIAGLNDLRHHYMAPVVASLACSEGIQNATRNMTRIMEAYLYFKSNGTLQVAYPRFTCAPADITFTSSYHLVWQGYTFTLCPVPGHTPGSICILLEQSLLFSGDYFIPGEDVITRLPGGDEEAYEKTGKPALRSLPEPIRAYPGHGDSFILTKEGKQAYGL